jgi:hypothetical protein
MRRCWFGLEGLLVGGCAGFGSACSGEVAERPEIAEKFLMHALGWVSMLLLFQADWMVGELSLRIGLGR